ncbi:MAG: thiamine-phosphate kinase [Clostridia bacterium]|nr:thiamine-phosphate kinase [Clostridia bacterium]MDH7572179.1 thiamine-phosphate kinase [Clostridia bacterium]
MNAKVSHLGEIALVARLLERIGSTGTPVGPGDDAAALEITPGRWLLATTDILVEGVHFRSDWAEAWQVGYKSLAVNVSDIAAMGGSPTYALISLALPGELSAAWVEGFYQGLERCALRWGIKIVGGDTVAAPQVVVTVTLLGEVEAGRALTRAAGRPGDILAVTGDLGAAAAGLHELENPGPVSSAARSSVLRRHLLPAPRVREGAILAGTPGIGAVIDLSDGLARGAWEVATACGLGAEVYAERLPVSAFTREVARGHGRDPLEWALYGGEDYELLFSVRPSEFAALRDRIRNACGTPVTAVGCLLPREAGIVLCRGQSRLTLGKGYEHFRSTYG